ncbi:hypothetical protein Bca4012_032979 [Brassica carinata]
MSSSTQRIETGTLAPHLSQSVVIPHLTAMIPVLLDLGDISPGFAYDRSFGDIGSGAVGYASIGAESADEEEARLGKRLLGYRGHGFESNPKQTSMEEEQTRKRRFL